MTTAPDETRMERLAEALFTALAQKALMIKAGETRRSIQCPRCGGALHLALVGRRSHLRMACEGGCGMELME